MNIGIVKSGGAFVIFVEKKLVEVAQEWRTKILSPLKKAYYDALCQLANTEQFLEYQLNNRTKLFSTECLKWIEKDKNLCILLL